MIRIISNLWATAAGVAIVFVSANSMVWADIVDVPEPGLYSAAAAGLACLYVARRMKNRHK